MAFLTKDEFSAVHVTRSATEITPAMIDDCLNNAIDELIVWCGESVVNQVAEAAPDATDFKIRRFRKAQSKLAQRELLQLVSARFRSGGIQVSERDLNDSAVNSYEKFTETEARLDRLYDEAKLAVELYLLPAEEIPTETSDVINYSVTLSRKAVW